MDRIDVLRLGACNLGECYCGGVASSIYVVAKSSCEATTAIAFKTVLEPEAAAAQQ